MKDFNEMTAAELNDEIELYREAGIAPSEKLSKVADKIEWLTETQKEHGFLSTITQEAYDAAIAVEGVDPTTVPEVGSVVLVPPAPADKKPEDDVPPPPPPPVQPTKVKAETITQKAERVVHHFEGELVQKLENVIKNGRMYVDVQTATRTARLLKAEADKLFGQNKA